MEMRISCAKASECDCAIFSTYMNILRGAVDFLWIYLPARLVTLLFTSETVRLTSREKKEMVREMATVTLVTVKGRRSERSRLSFQVISRTTSIAMLATNLPRERTFPAILRPCFACFLSRHCETKVIIRTTKATQASMLFFIILASEGLFAIFMRGSTISTTEEISEERKRMTLKNLPIFPIIYSPH